MPDFSNRNKNVFVLKMDRMIDRGALMSRYSRAANPDIRSVYDKEFAENNTRGSDFYRRVFLEYGDESVAELVTAQVGVQNVSNIASKAMEELRMGISFLEKSSRYVRYDRKVDGRYLYADPESIGIPSALQQEYDEHCESLFEFYSRTLPSVTESLKKIHPIGKQTFTFSGKDTAYDDLDPGEKEIASKAYENALRARVLDDVRYILPASTLTNIGMSGNGRSFINHILKLRNSGLKECSTLADDLFEELEGELPEIIQSAGNRHGKELSEFMKERDSGGFSIHDAGKIQELRLVQHEDEDTAIRKVTALMEYPHSTASLGNIHTNGPSAEPIRRLAELRKNRRHKPGRAFETVHYLFEMNPTFASFREIQRHRMLTLIRKPVTAVNGYFTPELFSSEPEILSDYQKLMDQSEKLWKKFRMEAGTKLAQYVVPFGYRYPFAVYISLAEATYFCELRSTPAAHYELRKLSWEMAGEIARVHPRLSSIMKFVDRSESEIGRIRAEARKEKKIRDMDSEKRD
ncbi:MAG: FAD-dependent thymidylate synthase [Thermoplasmataceae archaeon]